MRKKNTCLIYILIVACAFLLITACTKNEQTAEELMRYHNETWMELVDNRAEILTKNINHLIQLELSEGKQASSEYLQDLFLPELKDFIDEESKIKINDDSVQKLHNLLVEADQFLYNTMKEKGISYYNGKTDEDEFIQPTEEGKKLYDEFLDYREKLMKRNKLVIDHVRNDKGSYEEKMVNKSDAKNPDGIKWGEP